MNGIFIVCMAAGGLWALTHGTAEALGTALLCAGESAVQLMLTLAGGYMVWCGLLKILEKSGAMRGLSRIMEKPVLWLMGEEARSEDVRRPVCVNLAANLLGLGNAATPAGLTAMQEMNKRANAGKTGRPTTGMCMFLLLNATSLQLIPTTVLSLRASFGAADPGRIVLPALAGSLAATGAAVVIGFMLRGRRA